MAMLAQSFSFSNPPHRFILDAQFLSPSSPLSVSSPKFSTLSSRLLGNGNWVRQRNIIFQAKSADPDAEAGSSRQKDAVSSSPSTSFLSVLCPLLKLFSAGDPSQERNYLLEVATSSLSTLSRFPWGSRSLSHSLQSKESTIVDPPMRLQLFEFEACPFCRRVREAITELDLSVEVYPCPKGSVRHREMVRRFGGKEQFPFLIDPNTGISMYESGEIVKYLFQQYGKGKSPSTGLLESTLFTGWIPTILRAGRGMTLWEKARLDPPAKKLELFSYENNPVINLASGMMYRGRRVRTGLETLYQRYARIVREALCELELPYILLSVGEGSLRTQLLAEASGSKEVPFIIDPNTGMQIGDYKKILSYLFQTYGMATV